MNNWSCCVLLACWWLPLCGQNLLCTKMMILSDDDPFASLANAFFKNPSAKLCVVLKNLLSKANQPSCLNQWKHVSFLPGHLMPFIFIHMMTCWDCYISFLISFFLHFICLCFFVCKLGWFRHAQLNKIPILLIFCVFLQSSIVCHFFPYPSWNGLGHKFFRYLSASDDQWEVLSPLFCSIHYRLISTVVFV